MKRILFIDRDGTLIKETPPSYQIDSFEKLEFYPGMFEYMGRIAREFDYELLMVTNQDGLGTKSFPEDTFWPVQNFVLKTLEGEGVRFSAVYIDKTFALEQAPTRKPGTGMLTKYIGNPDYDLANSFVIGDRITDDKRVGQIIIRVTNILRQHPRTRLPRRRLLQRKGLVDIDGAEPDSLAFERLQHKILHGPESIFRETLRAQSVLVGHHQ